MALLDAAQLGVFNHTSYVDAVTMMWLLTPSGVSKASNADIPLLGTPPHMTLLDFKVEILGVGAIALPHPLHQRLTLCCCWLHALAVLRCL